MTCLTGARFNMKADIIRPVALIDNQWNQINESGEWVAMTDPDSGEIVRTYLPQQDNPATPDINETEVVGTIRCMARGFIETGIRMAGTVEQFGEEYRGSDFILMWFGPGVELNNRDQITNIRNAQGEVIWREEEVPGAPPTIFNVRGIVPMPDPFGRVVERRAMLERSPRQ